MQNQPALDAFLADNTPANAVRLAIEDHRATACTTGMTDWAYIDALREAEAQVEAFPALLAALKLAAPEVYASSAAQDRHDPSTIAGQINALLCRFPGDR